MSWLMVAIIVAATTLGDYLQTVSMKRHGEIRDFRPGALGRAGAALGRNWMILGSIFLMAVSFFAFLTLLSIADLSFAVPATAFSFVTETMVSRWLLNERVNWKRWTGVGLVACGVALLAL